MVYGVGHDANYRNKRPNDFTEIEWATPHNVVRIQHGINTTIYTTNANKYYFFSHIDITRTKKKYEISHKENIKRAFVNIGGEHGFYITNDNEIHGFGNNSRNRLGQNVKPHESIPALTKLHKDPSKTGTNIYIVVE